jgi:signal transduction histidine kinase
MGPPGAGVGNVRPVAQIQLPARWTTALSGARREAAFDVFVMLAVQAMVLVLLREQVQMFGPWGLVIQLVAAMVLLVRRRVPLTALFLMMVTTIAVTVLGDSLPRLILSMVGEQRQAWLVLAVPFVAYSGLVYGMDRRRAWLMVGIIALVGVRPWQAAQLDRVVGALILVVLPAMFGIYVASLTDRAERAEREQYQLAEQARADERVRLAAEMHDVVTHRISLMVLQAGALGVTAKDSVTRSAAEDLRAAGCQALEELRDLVGVLRSSPGEAAEDLSVPRAGGQAGVPDFAELMAESESVGVTVRLERDGDPALASPVVARTAYRVIQEALTNVRKHAPGAAVLVRVGYRPDQVRLTVRNAPPERRADAGLTASGSRTGLLGLRQRVELVSGTLSAAPTPDGGFEVEAILPAYVPTRDDQARPGPAELPAQRGEQVDRRGRSVRAAAGISSRARWVRGGE